MNALYSHELGLWLRLTVRGPNGQVEQVHEQPGLSFVEQMVRFLRGAMRSAAENIVDIDGTTRAPHTAFVPWMRLSEGGVGQDTEGVIVGSGSAVVAITDRALATRITDGAGAGQLEYLATVFGNFDADVGAGLAQVLVSRQFLNQSGATVTVNETGLYCEANSVGPTPFKFCIARDVVGTPIEVQDQRSLAVDYLVRASAT